MFRRTLGIRCSGLGNKKLLQVRAKVLISRGGCHFNAPSIHSQIHISTDGLVFLERGVPFWYPPSLHSKLNCLTYDFIFYEGVAEMDTPYFGFG